MILFWNHDAACADAIAAAELGEPSLPRVLASVVLVVVGRGATALGTSFGAGIVLDKSLKKSRVSFDDERSVTFCPQCFE